MKFTEFKRFIKKNNLGNKTIIYHTLRFEIGVIKYLTAKAERMNRKYYILHNDRLKFFCYQLSWPDFVIHIKSNSIEDVGMLDVEPDMLLKEVTQFAVFTDELAFYNSNNSVPINTEIPQYIYIKE